MYWVSFREIFAGERLMPLVFLETISGKENTPRKPFGVKIAVRHPCGPARVHCSGLQAGGCGVTALGDSEAAPACSETQTALWLTLPPKHSSPQPCVWTGPSAKRGAELAVPDKSHGGREERCLPFRLGPK